MAYFGLPGSTSLSTFFYQDKSSVDVLRLWSLQHLKLPHNEFEPLFSFGMIMFYVILLFNE